MWANLLVVMASGLSPGLTIETGSPDALCPELQATRAAVEARLGVVGVEGRAGWVARYTIWHAPGKEPVDFVRLQVVDPSGTLRLERDLPLDGESCATLTQIIALVLDRYFRDLGGNADTTAEVGAQSGPNDRSPPVAATPTTGHVSLGLAAAIRAAPFQPALAAHAAFERGFLRLALEAEWSPFGHEEDLGGGAAARLRTSVPMRLVAGVRGTVGAFTLHAGPELLAVWERASASTTVTGENSRVALGIGARIGAALPLGARLRLTATAALDRVVAGGHFTIDGRNVLETPWRGLIAAGLEIVLGS